MCNGNDEKSVISKRVALQQLIEASTANDNSLWTKVTVDTGIVIIIIIIYYLSLIQDNSRLPLAPFLKWIFLCFLTAKMEVLSTACSGLYKAHYT